MLGWMDRREPERRGAPDFEDEQDDPPEKPEPPSTSGYLLCWYCGDLADQRDHIRPRACTGAGVASATVPCCGRCNNALGDFPGFTDRARGQRVTFLLVRKLERSPPPAWTIAEAARELEGRLLDHVLAGIAKHERLVRRAEFAANRWGSPWSQADDDI